MNVDLSRLLQREISRFNLVAICQNLAKQSKQSKMLLHGKVLKVVNVVKDAASCHFHFHIHAHQVCPTLSHSQDIHMPVVVQTNRSWSPGEELLAVAQQGVGTTWGSITLLTGPERQVEKHPEQSFQDYKRLSHLFFQEPHYHLPTDNTPQNVCEKAARSLSVAAGSGFYGHISGQMQERLLAVWSQRECSHSRI